MHTHVCACHARVLKLLTHRYDTVLGQMQLRPARPFHADPSVVMPKLTRQATGQLRISGGSGHAQISAMAALATAWVACTST